MNSSIPSTLPLSASEAQIADLDMSIDSTMTKNARVAILLEFLLYKVQSGDIPPNHGLLRQAGSFVHQLPLVMGRGTITSSIVTLVA